MFLQTVGLSAMTGIGMPSFFEALSGAAEEYHGTFLKLVPISKKTFTTLLRNLLSPGMVHSYFPRCTRKYQTKYFLLDRLAVYDDFGNKASSVYLFRDNQFEILLMLFLKRRLTQVHFVTASCGCVDTQKYSR